MEICLMICIPNYMMPVLFQQCCMVLKYLDIYNLVILKKYKKNKTLLQSKPSMMGDMGWTDIYIKEWLCMLRYWNKVIIMDSARLERRIFMWDYNKGGDNWSLNCVHVYRNKTWCDIKEIENRLIDNYVTKWKSTIEKTPKLRTYIMFKDIFEPETYIIKCMSRRRRSLMSQFRTGILPLEIETGRYVPIFYKTMKKKQKAHS